MANVNKTRWPLRFLIAFLPTLLVAGFFHLGPRLGFENEPKSLHKLTLSDGSRLILVQKRNNNLLEAYSSLLYRDYQDGRTEVTGLGYEDSYWWLANLHASADGKSIEIRAWGTVSGVYDPTSKVTSWPGQRFPSADAMPVPVGDPIKSLFEK